MKLKILQIIRKGKLKNWVILYLFKRNPTKCSNTLKQLIGKSQRIV